MSNENKRLLQGPPKELLEAINLTELDWHAIIVGDGSGSRWDFPGGWASVLFDNRTGLRKLMYGALSDTTINICELTPYIYTMQWYARGPGKDLQKQLYEECGFHPTIDVHIITDCAIIANQGNRKMDRDANAALWASMDYFTRLNYKLHFHWLKRDILAANRVCDDLSKDMRHLITSIEQRLTDADLPDPYDDQFRQKSTQDPI